MMFLIYLVWVSAMSVIETMDVDVGEGAKEYRAQAEVINVVNSGGSRPFMMNPNNLETGENCRMENNLPGFYYNYELLSSSAECPIYVDEKNIYFYRKMAGGQEFSNLESISVFSVKTSGDS